MNDVAVSNGLPTPDGHGKNGKVELLRFFFCMAVLLFHEQKYLLGEASLKHGVHLAFFPHGSIGVEFFFLLSGFLMAKSIFRKVHPADGAVPPLSPNESLRFLSHKYASVFPQHCVAFVIAVWVWAVFDGFQTLTQLIQYLLNSIPNFLLIQMTGISLANPNHVEWYISCMLIAMALLYPLCRRYYTAFTRYFAPLGALLILGYLFYTTSSLTGVSVWTGLCYKSVLRAIIEVALGTTAFELSRSLASTPLSRLQRTGLTAAELLLLVCAAAYILLTLPKTYEFYLLGVLFLLLVISFSNVTWGSRLAQNRLNFFLGSLSLPIYLSQLSAIRLTQHFLPQAAHRWQLLAAFLLALLLAAVTMLLAKGFPWFLGQLRNPSAGVDNPPHTSL